MVKNSTQNGTVSFKKISLSRQITALAIPNIVSNLTVPLLSMVDLHLMGYLHASRFMGAVALGGVVFNMLYVFFAFLRMSVSGLTAQAYGKGDRAEQGQTFFRAALIAVFGGLLLLLLSGPISWVGFNILSGSEEVKALAKLYFSVRIWAAPAVILIMVYNGWFLGMQNAVYPMIVALLINVVNIVLSIIFVRYYNMDVRGVALGSVLSQYLGLLCSMLLFHKKYRSFYKYIRTKGLMAWDKVRHFSMVSSDIIIRTLSIVCVFTFFTSVSAGTNDSILAANTTLLQYLMLLSYFLDGYAYAAEALVGKFVGGKDHVQLVKAVRQLLLIGGLVAVAFSLIYAVFGTQMLYIFTDQIEVINTAKPYLFWLILLPLASFASYIWDGVYIGTMASKEMRNTMLVSVLLFFVSYYSLRGFWGNDALWFSMLVFMFARSVLQSLLAPKIIKKNRVA